MKDIIKDYFISWKIGGLSKLKLSDETLFVNIYIWCLYCFNIFNSDNVTLNENIMMFVMLMSVTLVYLSIIQHPLQMDKIFYLCPMNHEERKRYIWDSYRFRIFVHIIVFVTGIIIMIPFGGFKPFLYVLILLNDVVISIMIPMNDKSERGYIYTFFIVFIIGECNMIEINALSDVKENHMVLQIVLLCVFLFITLPLTVGLCKCIRNKLNESVDYAANEVRR